MADRILPTQPISSAYASAGMPGYRNLGEMILRNVVSSPSPLRIQYPQGVRSGTGREDEIFKAQRYVSEPGQGVREADLLLAMNRLLGAAPARGTVPASPRPTSFAEDLKALVGIQPKETYNPNVVPLVSSNEAARQAAAMYEMAGGDQAPKNEVMEKMLRFFTEAYGSPNSAQ